MKIWEAIQMLEQMDQNKEVIVTFGAVNKAPEVSPKHTYVIGAEHWSKQVEKQPGFWPTKGYEITCNANERWMH